MLKTKYFLLIKFFINPNLIQNQFIISVDGYRNTTTIDFYKDVKFGVCKSANVCTNGIEGCKIESFINQSLDIIFNGFPDVYRFEIEIFPHPYWNWNEN